MPYIKQEKRKYLAYNVPEEIHCYFTAEEPGDLNYFISKLVWKIWKRNPSYRNGNSLIGVLECVKQEFYRRLLAEYEDQAITKNGDLIDDE